ncbi:MAG TPA: beta-galactosidase, partial [Candidatus Saccharimonadia bacterium]|nr:beta-galactosidase [Candidatus Saccharimonadia bacterium]
MKFLSLFVLLGVFAAAGHARAANLSFVHDGLEVDAGSLGKFVLEYPAFSDAQQKPVHKLVERKAAGKSATIKYEDGAQVEMALGQGGQVTMSMSGIPADVKHFEFQMQIPIAYNQGGSWKFADKSGDFPKAKPASPHLFQGHAPALNITNYEGKTLTVATPEFSFLQLADNREWNWAIFHFKSVTPYDASRNKVTLTITDAGPAGGAKAKPLVDAFGQSAREEWAEKVKSMEELKSDVVAEKTYYDSLQPPARDAFGGLLGSKEKLGLKATGFFHVEKKNERWVLVDPAGNAFFHLGLCGVNPNDDYTLVKGRETAYEWLPSPQGEFASVFRPDSGGTIVSFHLVNQIRKYGQPYHIESYTARMIERMRKWGFTSVGAFSSSGEQARKTAQFPTVSHLPLNFWEGIPRVPGIHETFDPFDEKTRALVEKNLAEGLPAKANDPLIIGWYIVNEPIYEQIPQIVPTLDGSHACKRRFVQWLEEKYKTIAAFNTAWQSNAASFESLKNTGLAMQTEAAKQDAVAFATIFLDEYMKLVCENTRKHDPNHLIIGSRLQPGTISHEWISRVMGKHVDVMSFNYYTYGLDTALLKRIYEWTGGKPMFL